VVGIFLVACIPDVVFLGHIPGMLSIFFCCVSKQHNKSIWGHTSTFFVAPASSAFDQLTYHLPPPPMLREFFIQFAPLPLCFRPPFPLSVSALWSYTDERERACGCVYADGRATQRAGGGESRGSSANGG
jgi:hypothetical protein